MIAAVAREATHSPIAGGGGVGVIGAARVAAAISASQRAVRRARCSALLVASVTVDPANASGTDRRTVAVRNWARRASTAAGFRIAIGDAAWVRGPVRTTIVILIQTDDTAIAAAGTRRLGIRNVSGARAQVATRATLSDTLRNAGVAADMLSGRAVPVQPAGRRVSRTRGRRPVRLIASSTETATGSGRRVADTLAIAQMESGVADHATCRGRPGAGGLRVCRIQRTRRTRSAAGGYAGI